jgi:serine/tyrosine/threonine adenylyltransferase
MAVSPWPLDNTFVRTFPGDRDLSARSRQVRGALYARATPTAVAKPGLLIHSEPLRVELGLPCPNTDLIRNDWAQALSGNRLLAGMQPYAARYGGHQFGSWAGQLGDGRAMTLGELHGPDCRLHELQLKGAGPTAFSRGNDGRAVLRSSVREFICSEAMFHLGVPTTRALALVGTGEGVVRDVMYDGNAKAEPGAIVTRVAPSFLRFGNFQILTAQGEFALLKRLTHYTIARFFPELQNGPAQDEDGLAPETVRAFLAEVTRRTAKMVSEWMRVGFVHGVMNTDNMSIHGLTIDYGPYGWLEGFDPGWTPNTTDAQGKRYRFGNQPAVAAWNLCRLGEALAPLISVRDIGEELSEWVSDVYSEELARCDQKSTAAKLGLLAMSEGAENVAARMAELLMAHETDMTLFFRNLADVVEGAAGGAMTDTAGNVAKLGEAFYEAPPGALLDAWATWTRDYLGLLSPHERSFQERAAAMRAVNPLYVCRNYLAQEAITDAENGDTKKLQEWHEVLQKPYDEQPGKEHYAKKRPEWARHKVGCSMLSCSS